MTDKQIRMMLILKFGSMRMAVDAWWLGTSSIMTKEERNFIAYRIRHGISLRNSNIDA